MNITLYHQKSCPQCKMVETLLKNKKIEYTSCEDFNIMKEKEINHTPVLEVEGKLLSGKDIMNWIREYK